MQNQIQYIAGFVYLQSRQNQIQYFASFVYLQSRSYEIVLHLQILLNDNSSTVNELLLL